MMKRQKALILFILSCAMTYAQPRKESLVNYGVKAGFSSTIYDIIDLQVNTLPINNYSAKSEISSFFTAFARFNIKLSEVRIALSSSIINIITNANIMFFSEMTHQRLIIFSKSASILVFFSKSQSVRLRN